MEKVELGLKKVEKVELGLKKVETVRRKHQTVLGRGLSKQREKKNYQMHELSYPLAELRLTSLGCRYAWSLRFWNCGRRG